MSEHATEEPEETLAYFAGPVRTLLDTPPVQYEALNDRLTYGERDNLVKELEGLAQQAARLASYLHRRENGGSHKTAVKKCNQVVKGLRKAFGYHITSDLSF